MSYFLLCFAYYALCGALCVCLFDNELNPKFIGLGFNFLATRKNVMRMHKYRVVCSRGGNSISRISIIKFQSPLNRLAPLHNYKHACACVCVCKCYGNLMLTYFCYLVRKRVLVAALQVQSQAPKHVCFAYHTHTHTHT